MKYVISLIFTLSAYASPIKIMYETDPSNAIQVKNIFLKSYQIPEDLISLVEIKKCDEQKSRGKLDLCIKSNGDLEVVSVDRGFVHESLKIFLAP